MLTADPAYLDGPLRIWRLCDGKPGHENQSLGLAEALARRIPCAILDIPAPHTSARRERWRRSREVARALPAPDLVLGAGHATHGLLWWFARWRGGRSVVLMRPSLPAFLFDFVIAPAHDFRTGPREANPRILTTLGAVNRVRPAPGPREAVTLVLLGGPSAHHGWDGEAIRATVATLAAARRNVELADSRRSPAGTLDALRALPGVRAVHDHRHTGPGWLAARLASCDEVWVTEDSVSMIYEALSGGARVGVIPVPRLRAKTRVAAGVDRLATEGLVTRYPDWKPGAGIAAPPAPLAEADRAAAWLLARVEPRFPKHTWSRPGD